MATGRDVAIATPTLPGLLADQRTQQLMIEMSPFYEGRVVVVNRMPTDAERQELTKRQGELDVVLAPASAAREGLVKLRGEIALWLGGYPYLANGDTSGMVASYAAVMMSLPLWAVKRAIADIRAGKAKKLDEDGIERPLNPDYAPSATRLGIIAEKAIHDLVLERSGIVMLLRAGKTLRPDDPAKAERIGNMMGELADSLKRGPLASQRRVLPGEPSAEAEAQRKAKMERESIERQKAALREEYRRAGITKPLMASDGVTVVSLNMALRMGWVVQPQPDGSATLARRA